LKEKEETEGQTNLFFSCKKAAFNEILHGHPCSAFMIYELGYHQF